MNSYNRILTTANHERPDRPPCELLATDEVFDALRVYQGHGSLEDLLVDLGVDLRLSTPLGPDLTLADLKEQG